MNIKRFLKFYSQNFGISLSAMTIDRAGFVLNILSSLAWTIVTPLTVFVIYELSSGFQGWSFPELLIFIGTTNLVFGLQRLFFMKFSELTFDMVKDKTFDTVLLAPMNPIAYMLNQVIDYEGLIDALTGSVILIAGLIMNSYSPGFTNILFYSLFIIDGVLMLSAIDLIVGALSFKYVGASGIEDVFFSILHFTEYPLSAYGGMARFFFTFVIPLGVVNYFPSNYLLGKLTDISLFFELTGLTLAITALAVWLYMKGLKYYASSSMQ